MAASILIDTEGGKTIWGDRKIVFGTLSLDASYPTGGYDITALVGMGLVKDMIFPSLGANLALQFDRANKKVKAMETDGANYMPSEIADTTDLSAVVDVPFIAILK